MKAFTVVATLLPLGIQAISLESFGDGLQRVLGSTRLSFDDDFESPIRSAPFHNTCPANSPASCAGSGKDSCCYESTNGIFLIAQLWDYKPAIGANDTFTLHGLWCDKCNGGYNQYCNKDWEIKSVRKVLQSTNSTNLLAEMEEVWLGLNGDDEYLWLHEFNKHGTCMYTANPTCYSKDAEPLQYASDYFNTAVDLWRELPTFQWLEEAGLSPDVKRTFKVDEFQKALAPKLGVESVGLKCDRHNALNEVYYYFNLKGSVASGTFVPRPALGKSSCRDGFHWYPKGADTTPGDPGKKPDTGARGYLRLSGQQGCLISNGHWYTSGTCGTFRLREAQFGGVELWSSKGPCDVIDGSLTCGKAVKPAQFTQEGQSIFYGGEKKWSADRIPQGVKQVPISPGEDGNVTFELKFRSK